MVLWWNECKTSTARVALDVLALDVLQSFHHKTLFRFCGGMIARKDFLGEKREITTQVLEPARLSCHSSRCVISHWCLCHLLDTSIGYVYFFLPLRACVSMKTHVTNRRLKIILLL